MDGEWHSIMWTRNDTHIALTLDASFLSVEEAPTGMAEQVNPDPNEGMFGHLGGFPDFSRITPGGVYKLAFHNQIKIPCLEWNTYVDHCMDIHT